MSTPIAACSRSTVPRRSRMSWLLTFPLLTWISTRLGLPLASSMKVITPSMPLSAPFLPGLAAGVAAQRARLDQRQRPPLELVAVVVGQLPRCVARSCGSPITSKLDVGEHLLQAILLQGDRQVRDVDADPAAAELLRRGDGRAAATERIEHHVAGVAAGLDDAFQQGDGLLRGVAEAFGGLGIDRRNVSPNVLQRHPLHFVKVAFVPWPVHRPSLAIDSSLFVQAR